MMEVDVKEIKKMYDAFKNSGVTDIEFIKGSLTVKLGLNTVPAGNTPAPHAAAEPSEAASSNSPQPISLRENYLFTHTEIPDNAVCAKYVGTFFAGGSSGKDPLVQIKDFVNKGQHLGSIDVIGTLHDLTAPRDGTVRDILVEDGQPIQYNQPIFIID